MQSTLSSALTVNTAAPATVGVPVSSPAADSDSPAGSAPALTTNVCGPTPPTAVSVCAYGTFSCASGSVAGASVMTSQATLMV